MGTVEKKAGDLIKRVKIQDALLLALYGTVALTTAVVAPNAMRLIKYIEPAAFDKRNLGKRVSQAVTRLVSRRLLTREVGGGGSMRLILTKKGEEYADRLNNAAKIKLKKPKKWDGRWRIVIFDIWEKRRGVRDRLRTMLKKIGFVKIQNSVWIYPHDCEELLVFIRTELKLGKSTLYLVAEGVENDSHLRKLFKI